MPRGVYPRDPEKMREIGARGLKVRWAAYRALNWPRKTHREHHLSASYGLTELNFRQMWNRQFGLCAFCWNPMAVLAHRRDMNAPVIDHDKASGVVRALVHCGCNIHYINKHTMTTAQQLISYFDAHTTADLSGLSLTRREEVY